MMREYVFVLAMALAPLATPANARNDPSIHMVTYIEVVPARQGQVTTLLRQLASASRKDAGNLRFDVVHQKNRTNHFTVVEVWKAQRSNGAHELAPHTRAFRAALTPITGALYDKRWYKPL